MHAIKLRHYIAREELPCAAAGRYHERLRTAAERAHMPATALARDAIDFWSRQQLRRQRHEAIAAFAAEAEGTGLDLDSSIEEAGIAHLLNTSKEPK